jgi:hypothetical protein
MQEQSPYAANAHATRRPPQRRKTLAILISSAAAVLVLAGVALLYNLLLNAGGGAKDYQSAYLVEDAGRPEGARLKPTRAAPDLARPDEKEEAGAQSVAPEQILAGETLLMEEAELDAFRAADPLTDGTGDTAEGQADLAENNRRADLYFGQDLLSKAAAEAEVLGLRQIPWAPPFESEENENAVNRYEQYFVDTQSSDRRIRIAVSRSDQAMFCDPDWPSADPLQPPLGFLPKDDGDEYLFEVDLSGLYCQIWTKNMSETEVRTFITHLNLSK